MLGRLFQRNRSKTQGDIPKNSSSSSSSTSGDLLLPRPRASSLRDPPFLAGSYVIFRSAAALASFFQYEGEHSYLTCIISLSILTQPCALSSPILLCTLTSRSDQCRPSPIKRLRKCAPKGEEEAPPLPPASPLESLSLSDEYTKKKAALFFDFDCTLSARHLYGTIKGWERCVKEFNEVFPKGLEIYESDKKTFKDEFVAYIFGGAERIRHLREFFDSIRNELPTHLYVTTFGKGDEVISMLKAAGLLRYFSKIQASNGIWSEGAGFKTYRELKMSRQSKLDWIEERLLFQNILPNLTWFVDDSCANYDDGNGPGALCGGGKIHVFKDKEFRKNGRGITQAMIDSLCKSLRAFLS